MGENTLDTCHVTRYTPDHDQDLCGQANTTDLRLRQIEKLTPGTDPKDRETAGIHSFGKESA